MPRTPEQNTELILQLACDLDRYDKGTNRYGPEGQKLVDFFEAVTNYGSWALKNEDKQKQQVWDARNQKSDPKDRSETRGKLISKMRTHQNLLIIMLKSLGKDLRNGDYDKANNKLPKLSNALEAFSRDYAQYRGAAMELMNDDPVLRSFDILMEERTEFPLGKQLRDRLNGVDRDKPLDLGAQKPLDYVLPDVDVEDAEIPVFNVNAYTVEKARNKKELSREREYHDRFEPDNSSYEGVLGDCEQKAKRGRDLDELFATALAAAEQRRAGKPFNLDDVELRAQAIGDEPAFASMAQNRSFIRQCLLTPEKMNDTLELFNREVQAAENPARGPKSYDEYLRLHTWPNVPEGREKEYLAKAVAAQRLQDHGTPFDLAVVREEAETLLNQTAFQLRTDQTKSSKAEQTVTRWLRRENVRAASESIRTLRNAIRRKNAGEQDKNQKSWAGYRRMHTGTNVPQNASDADKRLCLAKAMVAIRGMSDDKPFNLKQARKQAAALVKNKYFRQITSDPTKVAEILATGKVTSLFGKMSDARKEDLKRIRRSREAIREPELRLSNAKDLENPSRSSEGPGLSKP